MSSPHGDEDRLAELVELVLARRAAGEAEDLDELVGGDAQLRALLQQALQDLDRLPSWFEAVGMDDGLAGRVLGGRFELEQQIGAGAMGIVYRARDRELGREVAVKLLRSELLSGERMAARLAREAEVLAGIRHRNVITLFDRGVADDGRVFLVMDLLRGRSLAAYVADADAAPRERLQRFLRDAGSEVRAGGDLRAVVEWIAQACAGVEAANEQGVMHRDIKPSNLFVEADGRVVVLDFGIGSIGSSQTLGTAGSPMGTPAYMAPEQLGGAELDRRTDVYGLAATLYHLVCGRAPFDGTVARVLHSVARQDPVVVDKVRAGVPADLAAIIEMGMSKQPERRYATAAELRDDLLAWLEHRPVRARRVSWPVRWLRRARRSPAVLAGAATLIVAAAAVGVWAWQSHVGQRDRGLWLEAYEHVGSSLVNDLPRTRPSNRIVASPGHVQSLDRMVQLGVYPGVSLAMRAMHRLDAGDRDGAAADLERIAGGGDAPFAAAVAAFLRSGDATLASFLPAEIPQLGGDEDRFLAALVGMRQAGQAPAWVPGVLAQFERPEQPGLGDLRVLQQFRNTFAVTDPAESTRRRHEVLAMTSKVRAARGTTSGILLHVRANLLNRLARYGEAAEVAAEGCRLCPDEYLFQLAHGVAEHNAGRHDAALSSLRRAAELQPGSSRSHTMVNDALLSLRRFDEAEAHLREVPWQQLRQGDYLRRYQEALLTYERAWALLQAAPQEPSDASDAMFLAAAEKFR